MKIKNKDLPEVKKGLLIVGSITEQRDFIEKLILSGKISEETFFRVSFNISISLKNIEPFENIYSLEKAKMIKLYGEKGADKKWKIKDEFMEDYIKGMNILNEMENEVELFIIPLSFLKEIKAGAIVMSCLSVITENDLK